MTGFIIWIIGALLTIKAGVGILTFDIALWKKFLAIIVLLATSWIGLVFFYLVGKQRLEHWLK